LKESFDEFCNAYVGGKAGIFYQRNQIFSIERLREQYDEISKAFDDNLKRGAITIKILCEYPACMRDAFDCGIPNCKLCKLHCDWGLNT